MRAILPSPGSLSHIYSAFHSVQRSLIHITLSHLPSHSVSVMVSGDIITTALAIALEGLLATFGITERLQNTPTQPLHVSVCFEE